MNLSLFTSPTSPCPLQRGSNPGPRACRQTELQRGSLKNVFLSLVCLFLFAYKLAAFPAINTLQDTVRSFSIDEIVVVSSTKETNSLQKLPGSVSILTPQQIANQQVTSLKNISAFVPNLYMPDYGAKLTSAIYIRGIGARSSGQTIGLYVDNAPFLDKSSFDFELMDLQRIEVLRGPQGTLYGRNAMSGIINVYTLSPFDFQGIKSSLSYGSYGQLALKCSGYSKLSNHLGVSAGLYFDQHDGFFTNAYDNKKIDASKSFGGNLKFHWILSPTLSAAYKVSCENTDQGAFPYGLYNETTREVEQVNINDESSYKRSLMAQNLSLTFKNESVLLTSVTGYQFLDDDMRMDQDFSVKSMFILNQLQKQHAFTEELTVKSRTENNYQWSYGLFGFYDRLFTKGPIEFRKDGIATVLQPMFNNLKEMYPRMPTLTITNESIYIPGAFKTPSYGGAFYHQSTHNNLLTEGLSITFGIRFDYEKQDFSYKSEAKMNLSMTMPPMIPKPMDISDRYPASVINEKLSQSSLQVLPKLAIKYECSPRTFTYISVAKGYKAGGYNVQMSADMMQSRMQYDVMNAFRDMFADLEIAPPRAVRDVISYKPEKSWNYELGVRSDLIKNRFSIELTLFYMDVSDLQITKFVESGSGRYLSNAGKAESMGVELSLRTRLSNELTADLNYGFSRATFLNYNYERYDFKGIVTERFDFKGNFIPYVPRNTLSLGIQYNKALRKCKLIDRFFLDAQCNAAGKIFWNETNNLSQPFYATINAQAGIRKGIISLSVWGRNLTDTAYSAFYFESFGNAFMQKGKPLQVGAKLSITL